ncbi:hypothetical protein B0H14DRAFT_3158445 [Mycena olivaceomarginata]|nr:hypothetical protein B0H14DRAFT_3158445 [Mycena olivaceomarginata]
MITEMSYTRGMEIGWEIGDMPCGREVWVEGSFTGDVLTLEYSGHWSGRSWWFLGKKNKETVRGPVYRNIHTKIQNRGKATSGSSTPSTTGEGKRPRGGSSGAGAQLSDGTRPETREKEERSRAETGKKRGGEGTKGEEGKEEQAKKGDAREGVSEWRWKAQQHALASGDVAESVCKRQHLQKARKMSCSEAVGSVIVLEGDKAQDLLGLCRACVLENDLARSSSGEREDGAGRRAAKMAGAIISTLCGGDSLASRIKTAGTHHAWL